MGDPLFEAVAVWNFNKTHTGPVLALGVKSVFYTGARISADTQRIGLNLAHSFVQM